MKLKHHGRYGYAPLRGRPDYSWPDGKRLAVYFALNLEHFSFGEGLGAELAPGGPQPDVLNFAWRDYGNRVGAWYLLDVFDVKHLPPDPLHFILYNPAAQPRSATIAIPPAQGRQVRWTANGQRVPGTLDIPAGGFLQLVAELG